MKLIIANWKMNPPTLKQAQALLRAVEKVKSACKVVIAPPAIYLAALKTKFDLCAQDLYWENSGPFTGKISAQMLKQMKVKYAIVGHSELRASGDTDEDINKKLKAALDAGIEPVLCVGYGLSSSEDDEQIMFELKQQLDADLKDVDRSKVIVAYEPAWAISGGDPYALKKKPAPEHVEKMAMFIRIKYKVKKVLYGGSTESHTAEGYLSAGVDGLLVGGASLHAQEFIKMIS
ncbi:triose-phosphate isomerase [Patescibacteria group bacterium]|nr:triose-phosphate isomerase [Patescibacteria group bacterium]